MFVKKKDTIVKEITELFLKDKSLTPKNILSIHSMSFPERTYSDLIENEIGNKNPMKYLINKKHYIFKKEAETVDCFKEKKAKDILQEICKRNKVEFGQKKEAQPPEEIVEETPEKVAEEKERDKEEIELELKQIKTQPQYKYKEPKSTITLDIDIDSDLIKFTTPLISHITNKIYNKFDFIESLSSSFEEQTNKTFEITESETLSIEVLQKRVEKLVEEIEILEETLQSAEESTLEQINNTITSKVDKLVNINFRIDKIRNAHINRKRFFYDAEDKKLTCLQRLFEVSSDTIKDTTQLQATINGMLSNDLKILENKERKQDIENDDNVVETEEIIDQEDIQTINNIIGNVSCAS